MMYQGAIVATMDWLYPLSGGAIVGLTGMGGSSITTTSLATSAVWVAFMTRADEENSGSY
jgi:hypothetical protein